jgi:hypothetical protein
VPLGDYHAEGAVVGASLTATRFVVLGWVWAGFGVLYNETNVFVFGVCLWEVITLRVPWWVLAYYHWV